MPRLLMVCLGLALGAQAQAPDSGMLLGIRSVDTYHSYWIVHTAAGAKVANTLPGIVIPHGKGFWRADVITVCEFDGTTNGHRAQIWESPVDKPAIVYQGTPCVKRKKVQDCGVVRAQLSAVSPSLISEQYVASQTEECEPRGGRWTTINRVRKLGESTALDLSAILNGPVQAPFWQAIQEGFAEMQRDGMNCPPPSEDEADLSDWSMAHQNGAWHAVANYSEGIGECEIERTMPAVLAHSATADTAAEPVFRSAKPHAPELHDLFVSPDGSWALVMLEAKSIQSLAVYEIKDGQLGRKLLDMTETLPSGAHNIVAAQWATGSHVAEWSTMLQAATKVVAPTVVVDPKRVINVFRHE